MRALLLWLMFWPVTVFGQSSEVAPDDLVLWVEVEETPYTPFVREMVLISIKGIYRRHITREALSEPDFEGFSWTQLGDDVWLVERIGGQRVKTFKRRMAIYPDQPGTLTIGSFTHDLTLTDEGDDWFEHRITSEPVTIEVAPEPARYDWWFPVKGLKIFDNWSNAPDQLAPGEGVLRVIRVEALGVTPEMLPPMPELTSPSAMIFPHPEKRFVELSPFGPISYAFWRWTIRPANDTSAIVEPFGFDYFDTVNRVDRTVTISAQRVAYGMAVPPLATQQTMAPVAQGKLPGWPMLLLGGVVFALCLGVSISGRRMIGLAALHRFALFDPLARRLRWAAKRGKVPDLRRAAARLLLRDGPNPTRTALLADLDRQFYAPGGQVRDLRSFSRRFLTADN